MRVVIACPNTSNILSVMITFQRKSKLSVLQFSVTTGFIITHSLVLLSALANSQHCHSVMTLISLLHSLSLSNPSLSSLALWLLCRSSVALSSPFPYRTCVCVHVMSHFLCGRLFGFSGWIKSANCWISMWTWLKHQLWSHTLISKFI